MVNFSVREGGRDMKEKENAEYTCHLIINLDKLISVSPDSI